MPYRAKSIWVASLLLCVVLTSEALTLGQLRGTAIVGQPLDLVVALQMAPGEDAATLCLDAEIFHADVPRKVSSVQLSVEAAARPQAAQVRIKSSSAVDEPVVTVNLRTRCGQKTERRYVLLAELPPLGASSGVSTGGTVALPPFDQPAASDLSSLALSSPSSATTPALVGSAPVQRKRRVRAKSDQPQASQRKLAAASRGSAREPVAPRSFGQSRLKLDHLELFSDRIALLELEHPDVLVDEGLPDTSKLQTLQASVQSLQTLVASNEASLADLKARLHQAETQRFPAWLVYVLAALVLACVATIAGLWSRQRRAQAEDDEWWSASVVAAQPQASASPLATPIAAPPPSASQAPAKRVAEAPADRPAPVVASSPWRDSQDLGVDVSESEMGESKFPQFMRADLALAASRPVPPVEPGKPLGRDLNSEEVTELRQQAEFFVALGQTDQAVLILEKLIHDSAEPNPHVYLDLLGLLHSLGEKTTFQQFREAFNRLFNGTVSEFARFRSEGQDLHAYPEVLTDIVTHWATPQAVERVESYVFRDERNRLRSALDLSAFREVLLLHAVAQSQLGATVQAGVASTSAAKNRLLASLAGRRVEPGAAATPLAPDATGMTGREEARTPTLTLDLDLSQALDDGALAELDPLNEIDPSSATPDERDELDTLAPPEQDNLINFQMPQETRPAESDKKKPG